jgi:alkylresorcinol/alkylpyrone synthase
MQEAMTIASVASALPKNRYTQQELTDELKKFWNGKMDHPKVLDRLHAHVGVETRYLSLPAAEYKNITRWGQANTAWIKTGLELGQAAISTALARAGLTVADLDALFVVSVTGIASPSLDARLMNIMGLNANLKRIPIFGLGCVAGAAGISRASDYVRAFPDQVACLLSVELCSLTLLKEDMSVANIISSGLFADGAAAVVVCGSDRKTKGPRVLGTRSAFYPNSEHVMGWDISEKGFQIVLSPEVPEVVKKYLARDVDAFLKEMGISRADIGTWILHPGGPRVLEAIAVSLELEDGALAASWDSLKNIGNLSSASVLCVLEGYMNGHRPPAGSYSVLGALGPGFCSELVLLQW